MVIDSAAAIPILANRPEAPAIRAAADGKALCATEVFAAECLNALRRMELRGLLEAREAEAIVRDLRRVPVRRVDTAHLREVIWSLRHNLTAYDAGYVALAGSLDLPLLTLDLRLARAAQGLVDVIVPGVE